MQYIKCTSCGHFNEIKSEYLVFCTSCHKKLENNFTDWKNSHPEKSFDDFKKLFSTSEITVSTSANRKKSNIQGLPYLVGTAIIIALFVIIATINGGKLTSLFHLSSIDRELINAASEINKSCPIAVDSETRLDNTIAYPGNVFQYNYTLINMTKGSFSIEELKNYLRPNVINYVSTNPEMETLRSRNVTVKYSYKDKEGVFLFDIAVGPDIYNK